MFTERDLFTIMKYTKSSIAQKVATPLLTRKASMALAMNKNLSCESWQALYNQRLSLEFNDHRRNLLSNAPTEALALRILDEQDAEVFNDTLSAGIAKISPSLAYEITTSKLFSSKSLYAMVGSGQAPLPLAQKLSEQLLTNPANPPADLASPWLVITSLATKYTAFTDQQILSLSEIYYEDSERLAPLIDLRPSIIPYLMTSTRAPYFYQAITPCRYLTELLATEVLTELQASPPLDLVTFQKPYRAALEGLYKNPNATYSTRQHALHLLAAATGITPTAWRPAYKEDLPYINLLNRQNTYPVTTSWDKVDAIDLPRVLAAVEILGDWRYPSLKYKTYWRTPTRDVLYEEDRLLVNNRIDPTLDKLGEQGWFIFLSMLVGWQESLASLLYITSNLVTADQPAGSR